MENTITVEMECKVRLKNAIFELNQIIRQENLLCFDANQEKVAQIKLAIDILKRVV